MTQVDRLRELLAAATPGPLIAVDHDWPEKAVPVLTGDGQDTFAMTFNRDKTRADAALMAEGITALPLLLDIAEAAAEVAELWSGNGGPFQLDPLRRALAALEAQK